MVEMEEAARLVERMFKKYLCVFFSLHDTLIGCHSASKAKFTVLLDMCYRGQCVGRREAGLAEGIGQRKSETQIGKIGHSNLQKIECVVILLDMHEAIGAMGNLVREVGIVIPFILVIRLLHRCVMFFAEMQGHFVAIVWTIEREFGIRSLCQYIHCFMFAFVPLIAACCIQGCACGTM